MNCTLIEHFFHLFFLFLLQLSLVSAANELWPTERPNGMPNIVSLEVMCAKDHMDVHMTFSHPFEGIVSSKGNQTTAKTHEIGLKNVQLHISGQHSDPRCIYVPPSTGKTFFSFRIAYSRCGTKPDLNGQFYENTVKSFFPLLSNCAHRERERNFSVSCCNKSRLNQ